MTDRSRETTELQFACATCSQQKAISEFYFRKDTQKYHYSCKTCTLRKHGLARMTPEGRRKRREYHRSIRPRRRETERRHAAKYRAKYPEKASARQIVRRAIDAGTLTPKSSCEKCGVVATRSRRGLHAHHHNGYDKPTEVQWLCSICHSEVHRTLSQQEDGK